MNGNQRNLLLVDGYIRESESLKQLNIPQEISPIIALFYPNEFRFQSDHPKFKVSDDGLTVSNPNGCYGTILFGPFFEQNEKLIFTVKFSIGRSISGFNGFGFATDKFTEFVADGSDLFDRENYSRIIFYAKGQRGNSWNAEKFKTSYFSEISLFDPNDSESPIKNGNSNVCVQLNMITKVGKVYNEQYPDKPSALIDLRSDDGICIALAIDQQGYGIEVVDQQIRFEH